MDFDIRKYLLLGARNTFEPQVQLNGNLIPYRSENGRNAIRISMLSSFPNICTLQIGWTAKAQAKQLASKRVVRMAMKADETRGRNVLRRLDEDLEVTKTRMAERREEALERTRRAREEGLSPQEIEQVRADAREALKGHLKPLLKEEVEVLERRKRVQKQVREIPTNLRQVEIKQRQLSSAANRGTTIHDDWRGEKTASVPIGHFVADFSRPLYSIDSFALDWKTYGDGRVFEFPIRGRYRDMPLTGHSDFFEVDATGIVLHEEWKPDKAKTMYPAWEKFFKQAGLYRMFLTPIFGDGFQSVVVTYDPSFHNKESLKELRSNPLHASTPAVRRDPIKDVDLEECLESAYRFFTGQTPCEPYSSGLCQYCNWRFRCDRHVYGGKVEIQGNEALIRFKTGSEHVNFD